MTPEPIDDGDGWDLAFGRCCPGDDIAHGHKHAIDTIEQNTKELLNG